MSDCPNAEMRDRLPDLLHEGLDASARAVVVAHVADCPDCHAELELLRAARVALVAGLPQINVSTIARLVVERSRVSRQLAAPRARWRDWRIAASIVALVVSSALFVRLHHRQDAVSAPPVAAAIPRPTVGSQNTELSAEGGVSDLSENDLRVLVDDLPTLDALPAADPEPVTVRVSLPGAESME
jgi:anti-sigma factor RsiW